MKLTISQMKALGFRGAEMFATQDRYSIYFREVPEHCCVVTVTAFDSNTVSYFLLPKKDYQRFKDGKLWLCPPGAAKRAGAAKPTKIIFAGELKSIKHLRQLLKQSEIGHMIAFAPDYSPEQPVKLTKAQWAKIAKAWKAPDPQKAYKVVTEWCDPPEPDLEIFHYPGLEPALIGLVYRNVENIYIACYSFERLMELLMERDKMTHQEAAEHVAYNIEGAHHGEGTPFVLY